MSPYEQQELALKEAKMIRELESMKESREMTESFRQSADTDRDRTSSIQEEGYLAETGKKGKFRRTFGGVGSAFKTQQELPVQPQPPWEAASAPSS
ncbi:MAG: hypothetical protein R3D26_16420 [Cyanobacteriota/Melainabacteria group bacterium]